MAPLTVFWTALIGFGVLQGLLLTGLLLVHPAGRPRANRHLAGLLLIVSVLLTFHLFHLADLYRSMPELIGVNGPLWWLFAPLLYLYIRDLIAAPRRGAWRDLLHLLPAVVIALYSLPFILLPGEAKLAAWEAYQARLESGAMSTQAIAVTYLNVLQFGVYLAASLRLLRRQVGHRRAHSADTRLEYLQWTRTMVTLFMGYVAIDTVIAVGYAIARAHYDAGLHVAMVAFSGFTHVIAVTAVRQPGALFPEAAPMAIEPEAAPRVALSADVRRGHIETLRALMERERLYRHSELKLGDLAGRLAISTHHLSAILNGDLETTFYDFVNGYRVREVQDRLGGPDAARHTLLAIALDAGFNSKTSFNRIFKKHAGCTPSAWMREARLDRSA